MAFLRTSAQASMAAAILRLPALWAMLVLSWGCPPASSTTLAPVSTARVELATAVSALTACNALQTYVLDLLHV